MTTSRATMYNVGDTLLHPARPEWGPGRVLETTPDHGHAGAAQKLRIRFEHAGVKTVSTAYVEFQPVSDVATLEGRPLSGNPADLAELPEAATDPLRPLAARLAATLDLYKYTNDGSGLIAWAAAQSGERDPLATRTRHDLEELFRRFARARDAQLRALVPQVIKEVPPSEITPIVQNASPAAREALQRANRPR